MSPVIGYATMPVIPSLKGMDAEIRKQLGGIDSAGKTAGESAGRGFTSSFLSGARSLAGALTSVVSSAATVAATAAGGLLGASLVKGMGRLTAIDDARGKLVGLGHDTESVAKIMESALDSVRGTAFGLGEAATVSATAVAAGIKPGEELTRYLKLIADTSTIAGVGLAEVGSIINKTTTSGRVFTQELNQLADRGLPVFQWLQDEYGVTAEAFREMVAAGQVDAETFRRVIEENIGGAALASGQTFRGAFANVGAAMGRFGATILDPFFQASKDVFPAFIGVFDELATRVAPVMERIAASDGFQRLLDWFTNLPNAIGPALDGLKNLGPLLAPLAAGFAALGASNITSALGPLGALIPTLNPLVAIFAAIVATSPELREAFVRLGQAVAPLAQVLVEQLGAGLNAVLAPAIDLLAEAVNGIAAFVEGIDPSTLTKASEVFKEFATEIGRLAVTVGEVAYEFAKALMPAVKAFAKVLVSNVIPALTKVIGFFADNKAAVVALVSVVGTLFAVQKAHAAFLAVQAAGGIVRYIASMNLVQAVTKTWTAVQWLLNAALSANPIGLIVIGLAALTAGLVLAWQHSETFRNIVTGAFGKVKEIAEAAFNWVKDNWPLLLAILTGPIGIAVHQIVTHWDTIKNAFTAVKDWIAEKVTEIVGFILSIPRRIGELVTSIATKAAEIGKSFIDGVTGAVETGLTWFLALPRKIVDKIAENLARFEEFGKKIVDAIVEGIKAAPDAIKNALKSLIPSSFSIGGPGLGGGIKLWASGTNFHPGGLAIVGERGPELLNLPRGSQVIPNHDLSQYFGTANSAARASSNTTVNLHATYTEPNPLEWVRRAEFLAGVG